MIQANVYFDTSVQSPEVLKQAVIDGVDIIGQYIGGITIAKTFNLRLPVNGNGLVSPYKVGFGQFDHLRELHIIVAPLDRADTLGYSFRNSGVSFLHSQVGDALTRPPVVSHEIAHSVGYVLDDAPQLIVSDSGNHCSDQECIMRSMQYAHGDQIADRVASILDDSKKLGLDTSDIRREFKVTDNFCTCCRADMRDTHEEQISRLHVARLARKSVHIMRRA